MADTVGDIVGQVCRIPAADGYPLAADVFRSPAAGKGTVIINAATAVHRRFYRHFAGALANAGYDAITYDYRGIGGSRPESLRGFAANAIDWGLLDMAGVVDWVRQEQGAERVFLVGHSIGGQVAGMLPNQDAVDGMLTVSAQSGHWRLQGEEQKWLAMLHVHLTLPVLAYVFGYMPWSWYSGAEDLPKGVALDWARWCRDRKYLLGDDSLPLDRFSSFRAPVLAYSFSDDKWGTPQAVDEMMAVYPNVERRHVEPAQFDVSRIGHFGYFRRSASRLWNDAIGWFDRTG